MKMSRRGLLAGAVAVPAAAGLANWRWKHGHGTVMLFDPEMAEGREFAAIGDAWNRKVMPIEGDPIRFGREIFNSRPALVQGVSRQADTVLLEEVGAEAGYDRTSFEVRGDAIKWTMMPRIRVRG